MYDNPWYPPKDEATQARYRKELDELLKKNDRLADKIQRLRTKLEFLETNLAHNEFRITVHQCWLGFWREFPSEGTNCSGHEDSRAQVEKTPRRG